MKVKDQIKVLQDAIDELNKVDPEMEVVGHVDYPYGCYSGDVVSNIDRISVELPDEESKEKCLEEGVEWGVVLAIYY